MSDSKVFPLAAGLDLPEQEAQAWGDGFAAAMRMAAGNTSHLFASQHDCLTALFKELASNEEHGAEFMATALKAVWADEAEDPDAVAETLKPRAVEAAGRYLIRKGYRIVDFLWASPSKETVDIVAVDRADCLVFVWVSVVKGSEAPAVETAPERRAHAEKVAAEYVVTHSVPDNTKLRFDEVTITAVDSSHAILRHHENFLISEQAVAAA